LGEPGARLGAVATVGGVNWAEAVSAIATVAAAWAAWVAAIAAKKSSDSASAIVRSIADRDALHQLLALAAEIENDAATVLADEPRSRGVILESFNSDGNSPGAKSAAQQTLRNLEAIVEALAGLRGEAEKVRLRFGGVTELSIDTREEIHRRTAAMMTARAKARELRTGADKIERDARDRRKQ
jgi:hypothetical protein